MKREWPSTIENSQMVRVTPGSSVKMVTKRAKSTCACLPAGVSNRASKGFRCVVGTDRSRAAFHGPCKAPV